MKFMLGFTILKIWLKSYTTMSCLLGWKNKEVMFNKNVPKFLVNKRVSIIASVSRNKKIGYGITYGKCSGMVYKKHVEK